MTSDDRDPLVPDEQGSRSSHVAAPKKHRRFGVLQEAVLLVVVALVIAVAIKQFFVQAYYIPSESMEPGLQVNDRILVEKPSYWFSGTPQRGDVVVFSDPGGWLTAQESAGPSSPIAKGLAKIGLYPAGGHLVKRVIGVGGDTVHCCTTNGRLTVNGTAIDESSFVNHSGTGADGYGGCDGPEHQDGGAYSDGGCNGWTATVPAGHLFVMGDNRNDSADSSYHLCSPPRLAKARSDPAVAATCADAYVPTSDVVGKVVALMWPASRMKLIHRPSVFATVPNP